MSNAELSRYSPYKQTIFRRLGFDFIHGKKLLDVGCGDGSDADIFINAYGLQVYGTDIFTHPDILQMTGMQFQEASIYHQPFPDAFFDYVFLHDVLHHIDEEEQSPSKHLQAMRELKRILKPDGYCIIVEGNRYNPMFYPHMVLMRGHNHWRQSYFKRMIKQVFPHTKFKFYEAHHYPWGGKLWKPFEWLMNNVIPRQFAAYNTAVARND